LKSNLDLALALIAKGREIPADLGVALLDEGIDVDALEPSTPISSQLSIHQLPHFE
jgi:hypothetical protein